ncbi:MAG: alpha/beta hydrolase [Acidocella sp. 20-57-95]|nr:MAG: alpha/beta hydrolase [Acidocella sp. 20-57-95]OYV61698.1 MAG: alpha/beta hydrolase [Acidocella sp. 21-58-7]HQT63263.1 alpha/beta fold hydrolase [Acidocella sp.]HQU04288.1 alpha/beta fold hydrolase [Acidocella sp.]
MILNSIEQGSGQPIILLHGLFGAAKNLGVLARGLSACARVISLDLRNHGDSPHSAEMTYPAMAHDVAETIAALGIHSAMLVGHSMGGKTAMHVALNHPDLISKLAVLDIAPVTYQHGYDAFAAAMQQLSLSPSLTRAVADATLAENIPDPSYRAFLLNNLILGDAPRWRVALNEIRAAMPEMLKWQDPPDTAAFPNPALFLHGGKSDYVRPSAHEKIAALFPDARIETIENAAHWLHAEQPQAVVAALQAFFFP